MLLYNFTAKNAGAFLTICTEKMNRKSKDDCIVPCSVVSGAVAPGGGGGGRRKEK